MEEKELELGSLLKKSRKEKGLSLDDIQEETKIRKKYLEAIEENNFDVLPGKVYLKVFIKGYAREVGLNYQELLKKYHVLNIKEEEESNLQKDYLNGTKVPTGSKNNNFKKPFKIVFIILLLLFLGATAVYTFQYFNNSEIGIFNSESSQNENIEEQSLLLELPEKKDTEVASENGNNNTSRAEESADNSVNISDKLDSIDNQQLTDPIDSSVLTEENAEIIDQNNSSESEELNFDDQSQISEIIVSDEFDLQQEDEVDFKELNTQNEVPLTNEGQSTSQTSVTQEGKNTRNEEQASIKSSNLNSSEAAPVDEETKIKEEAVLNKNIEISANDTAWVTIDVDGTNVFSGILEAGDQQEFEVEDRLYIKIGNGSAITAEIAGKSYGPWAGDGEIAEVEFLNEGEEIKINNLRN
ncbi:uncharacterized protein DUF4115 [Halanaerobium saccharolyticum]|uniref:Uncharacterized protein DUF4115 n=1 Tax=Halanaerobium saccharolyticum TaxID=43595 RepID=A0A4R6LAZ1_9FIRM|nr:helix-turn-helix domain-containing protein [Halanaerobium saccharolyticum]TDO73033.1 uncharacterized protein DUF4115 [Halanaerobium saccharolyticum]